MKIVQILPHVSSGGMPQVAYVTAKKLQEDGHDVYVIVWEDIAPIYRVQRDLIEKLLPSDHLIMLYDPDRDTQLLKHIEKINPDIIHLQEFPELWMPEGVARAIYGEKNRKYKIIETSHDSGFKPENKRFKPDGFAFISEFHPKQYKNFGVPYRIVEYPTEYKDRPDRTTALRELNLDPEKKHVLNVGLFTPRKNQAEIFEIARKMPNILFHFVGNQADNFKFYWEPLMANTPKNCILWGERNDVDKFYSSMDLFLFTSKGTVTDRETNPLVLKEALSWRMPVLMYKLEVYCGMYDKNEYVTYINDDISRTCRKINNIFYDQVFEETLEWMEERKEVHMEVVSESDWKKDAIDLEPKDGAFVSSSVTKEKLPTDMLYEVDQYVDFDFSLSFVPKENKVFVNYYAGQQMDLRFSVRDIHSKMPIFPFGATVSGFGNLWVMPVPLHVLNFQEDPYFYGFTVEAYLNGKMIQSKDLLIKDKINLPEPNVDFSKVDPFDSLYINYYQFFYRGIYEHLPLDYKGTVVDIGANSGSFVAYALKKEAGWVIAVEPGRKAFQNLKNVYGIDYPNVFLDDRAIGGETKEVTLYSNRDNSTISSIREVDIKKSNEGLPFEGNKVQMITLDQLFEQHKLEEVNLVKIDVEGAEYDIIVHANIENLKKVKTWLIEYHYNEGYQLDNLIRGFQQFGYDCKVWDAWGKPLDVTTYAQGILTATKKGVETSKIEQTQLSVVSFKLSVDGSCPKVEYTATQFTKDAIIECRDKETNLLIYRHVTDLQPGINYWIILSSRIDDLSGLVVTYNGNIVIDQDYNNSFDNIISRNWKNGVEFKTLPNDMSAWFTYYEVFLRQDYRDEYCEVEEGDIVVDMGANYGAFSLYAADHGAKEIYAIEPVKGVCRKLRQNTTPYPVHVIQAAMAKESGKQDINVYESTTIGILADIDKGQNAVFTETVQVETMSFNDLVINYSLHDIDFLKMDMEAGEYGMFESIDRDYLKNHVKKIAAELHNLGTGPTPWRDTIIPILNECGFKHLLQENTNNTARLIAWKTLDDEQGLKIEKEVVEFVSQPLKILQVSPGESIPIPPNGWGAIEKIIWNYKLEMEKLGHKVDFMWTPQTLQNYKNYDLVHVHMADQALELDRHNIPYIFTCHDHHVVIYGKNSACWSNNYGAVEKSLASVVPGEYLLEMFNSPKLKFIPHGVNLNFYKPKDNMGEDHGVLCVGNNGVGASDGYSSFDRKGFKLAIEACKRLKKPITLAGPTKWNVQYFKENPTNYDKAKIVYDLDDQGLLELYQSHSFLVHASNVEAGHPPLTVLEAMACGLPVIGTYTGKNVLHKDLTVKRNPELIMLALKSVCLDYSKYRDYSLNTVKDYSWSNVVKKYLVLYESVLRG